MMGSRFFPILCVLFLLGTSVFGQDTILMGTNNHQEIVSNYCVLYADNGPGNPHSPRVDASYTIKATDSTYNCKIIMRSEYEYYINQNNSYSIYDGDTNSQERIIKSAHDVYYNTMLYTELENGEVTVKFHADNDNPPESFEIIIQFCDCQAPSDVTHEYIDSTSVMLRWDGHGYSSFAVDYILFNPPVSSSGTLTGYRSTMSAKNAVIHTVYSSADSVLITGLPPYSFIHYDVYGSCDSVPMCGILGNTDCRHFTPENIEVTYDEDSIYLTWDSVPNANWYVSKNWGNFTLTNNNYYSMPKTCNTDFYIRATGGYGGFYYCNIETILSDFFGCPNVYPYIGEVNHNSIEVYWYDKPDIEQYVVKCTYDKAPYDVVFQDTIPSGVEEVLITGLEEATAYRVYAYTLCDACGMSTGNINYASTTLDRCIDFINVYAEGSLPTTGNYDNPYQWENNFRGSVVLDTISKDNYTNYMLKKVPSGEKASVKLGNSSTGAEAESISYDYFVDTIQFDMLTLKYAVVLQNPDHTLENQPRFTLEILDSSGVLIDSTCAFADFYASGDLGWNQNTYNNSTIIWKDWTTIGIDIAPYHGQNVRVRLTTYDCKDGGHFGYAYFTLNCDRKRIYLINACDAADSVHLQAPLGFEYKWYKDGDTTVISTNYDILVPIDNSEYHCTASFVGKPECNFTISSHSIAVTPHSIANFTIDTCQSKVFFENLSTISMDSTYSVFTEHIVDSVFWIFEDGSTSVDDTLSRNYPNNGLYDVKLVSTLSNSQCIDTLLIPININFNFLANISGPDTVCHGDTMILSADLFTGMNTGNVEYLWDTGQTTDSIIVVANETKQWSLAASEGGSCRGAATKTIVVNPTYYDTIYASICDNQIYQDSLFNVDSAGVYTWYGTTDCNCDSLITLVLTVNPTHEIEFFDTICLGEVYTEHNFHETNAGVYVQNLQNIYGCDSVVRLNLHVSMTHNITINAEICDDSTYTQYGFSENQTGVYTQTLPNIYGCDSIVTLNLVVHPTYDYVIDAEICDGETYDENNFFETQTGVYTQEHLSIHGCDSIVHLNLVVNPVYNDTIYSELCGVPYDANNFYEEESGIYTQHLQTINGCDSIVTLNLTVWDLFTDSLEVEIYKGDTYDEHGFSESTSGEYTQVYTDLNGCDSTYFLDLRVINLNFPNMVSANDDGINDVFEIIGLLNNTYFSWNELLIYTRHGKRVYYKENIQKESDFWAPASTNSAPGTYFFRFKAKGKTRIFDFTGSIEVFR
ncbi:MAG: gliding motility-associated C-terminal domain-containing protein [Bacteroidales bacterium]|nr:gliding motility-associated C-terminal domain-containing protein [Bacteroidales bacterium]